MNDKRIRYKRNITLVYFQALFKNMIFHRGIFILFLLERGINNVEIGILQTTLFLSIFILEVPTGLLGDKIGRKWSLFIGLLLMFINAVGMVYADNFYLFLILFIVEGSGFAFESGAIDALIYDSLKFTGREEEYVKINSRIGTISSVVLGLAMAAGGFLQTLDWNYIYVFYAVAIFIAMIFVSFMHDDIKDYSGSDDEESKKLKLSIDFFKSKVGKSFALFLLALGCYNGIMIPYFIYGQNLFHDFGWDARAVAILYAVIQLSTGLVYLTSEKISHMAPLKTLLKITLLLAGVLMLMNVFNNVFLSLAIFFIVMVFPDIIDILIDNYVQENIRTEIRATLLSARELVETIFVSLGYFLYGFLFKHIGILPTYSFIGILLLLPLIIFSIHFQGHEKSRADNE